MMTLVWNLRTLAHSRTRGNKGRRAPQPAGRKCRPRIELLEDRALLSTYTVTDLGDALQGQDFQGDLRYCITQANANADPSNQIVFQDGLTGTITLQLGDLQITKDLEIDGPGSPLLTISGNHQSGVLNITKAPTAQYVHLSGLTIADGIGILNEFGNARFGGGLYNDHAAVTLTDCTFAGNILPGLVDSDGAIYNRLGTMVLDSCALIGNYAGSHGDGGAIGNAGTMTLTNCTISGNHAFTESAIGNQGTMTLVHCTVSDNIAEDITAGNAINNFGSHKLTIADSTISGNVANSPVIQVTGSQLVMTDSTVADNTGGALNNFQSSIQLTGCTISGNVGTLGAAIYALSSIGSDTNLTNCTISGNSSSLQGAIILFSAQETLELTSCTIVGNTGGLTGGVFVFKNSVSSARAFVRNTIIAGNQGSSGADVWGPVLSFGYNLIGQADTSSGWVAKDLTGTSDQPLDPKLGPLQDNGGPTLTYPLYSDSPAIHKGDPSLTSSVDQRGSTRGDPITPPDIGAFNAQPAVRFTVLAPAAVVQGQPFTVTVIALDTYGNRASTYLRTIHFSSSDPAAQLPGDYPFVRDDLGAQTFTVTLNTVGSQTVHVQDTMAELFAGTATVDVQSGGDPGGVARPRRAEFFPPAGLLRWLASLQTGSRQPKGWPWDAAPHLTDGMAGPG
jgi:hypothetical protein